MNKTRLIEVPLLMLFVAMVLADANAGKINKWVDEQGQVHFGDVPPKTLKSEELNINEAYEPDRNHKSTMTGGEVKGKTPLPLDKYHIVVVNYDIVEKGNYYWRYTWKLKIRNLTNQELIFDAKLLFMTRKGVLLDSDVEYGLKIPAFEAAMFRGEELIDRRQAHLVEKIEAQINL